LGDSNKWLFVFFLVVVPLVYVSSVLYARTHTQYYLVTGPVGGTYDLLGGRITDALNTPDDLERGLHLNIVPDFIAKRSCGAFDNLYAINHRLAQIGFAEDGLPLMFQKTRLCALQGADPALLKQERDDKLRMRALMILYRSPLQIIARRGSLFSDASAIPPHTKVYLGPAGSATEYVAGVLLSHHGISVERVGQGIDIEQAVEAMLNHKIDVGFFLTALNTGAIQKLSQSEDFKLLSVDNAPSLRLLHPYLTEILIPASTFHGASKDVLTLGTNTILVASTDLSDTAVYEAAKKIANNIQDILHGIPFNLAKSIDNDPGKELYYPLHQGAIRFYDRDPPFILNPHILAGIGTYLSVLFASWKVSRQFIRNYRVHRILHAIDKAALAFQMNTSPANPQRYLHYTQHIRKKALGLLRFQRITTDDYGRIGEYIKGHSNSQLS
jgi:TRAP transporter TAXI family solute receptor